MDFIKQYLGTLLVLLIVISVIFMIIKIIFMGRYFIMKKFMI